MQGPVLREAEPGITPHQLGGILPRLLEEPGVGNEAGGPELRETRLARSEELPRPTDLEIDLREAEPILGLDHGVQSLAGILGHGLARQ